jgi:hypothetical protein
MPITRVGHTLQRQEKGIRQQSSVPRFTKINQSPQKNEWKPKGSNKSKKAPTKCGIKAREREREREKFPNISVMTARRLKMMMPVPYTISSGI